MAEEIFISYAHQDRAWAAKLAADLRGRGVSVFFDQSSLRDGEKWEDRLKEAVKACRHLICLWSKAASGSQWVQQEVAFYRVSERNPVVVMLDTTAHTFGSIHNIVVEPLQAAYGAGGVDNVASADWIAFIDRIMKTRNRAPSLRVPVALLTLDAQSAKGFSDAQLQTIQMQLGLSAADLASRYGKRRLDWKPFTAVETTIEDYLNETRAAINQWLADYKVNKELDWDIPDERFWSEDDYASLFAARMEDETPGLIVIDPVAPLQLDVQLRLPLFDRCLRLARVAIVALHPAAATPQAASFRRWIERYTVTLLRPYVSPRAIPEIALSARLGIGVDDMGEMRRLLKTSIGDSLRSGGTATPPAAAALSN
jgi:hypothetical protein